jgi:YidC/Oxa1 family membrane protein insertase
MEKRVFLAILLSFAVLAGYQALVPPPRPAVPTAPAPTAAGPGQAANAGVQAAVPVEANNAAAAPAAAPLIADEGARDIVVETDLVRAVFSTAGATLRSWQLKKYLEDGQPLELVPTELPADLAQPFTISTTDASISKVLAKALFRPSVAVLSLGAAPGTLSFQYSDQSGLNARKTFYFQPEGKAYVLKVEAAIDVSGASRPVTIAGGPAIGLGYAPDGSTTMPPRAIQFRGTKVTRLAESALREQPRYEGELRLAGVEDHYFLNAALPGSGNVRVDFLPITLPVPGKPAVNRHFVAYSVSVPGAAAMSFFLGPKDFDVLRDIDPKLQLTYAIDFGMFSALVVPLLLALKWINSFVGNFGWSIIVLTIFINLIIFPLRHRSMVSMRKMQSLQPEVKAIQDRYAKYKATDPEKQKMNQEMMALYKQKGVNPVSGCLPMLLTMPVLFAFYAMLSVAIELRGAPFMFWITDLARHDPLYVTPVMMAGTMFIQQRMMPSTGDPIQQKVFLLMPVIFLASFLWAPSGLVIYWFMSNILAIGQQYLTNRMIGAPVVVRPPAKPMKSVGSGTTKKP